LNQVSEFGESGKLALVNFELWKLQRCVAGAARVENTFILNQNLSLSNKISTVR